MDKAVLASETEANLEVLASSEKLSIFDLHNECMGGRFVEAIGPDRDCCRSDVHLLLKHLLDLTILRIWGQISYPKFVDRGVSSPNPHMTATKGRVTGNIRIVLRLTRSSTEVRVARMIRV